MHPASLSIRSLAIRPLSVAKWLSLLGLFLMYVSDPNIRRGVDLLLKIAWLYFVTGARG